MGTKDITQKTIESHNDVFADIVNVLLFDGKQVVKPNQLMDKTTHSQFRVNDKLRNQERDIAKLWNDAGTIQIAFLGIENQTQPDRDMVFRVLGYDGAAYREQIASRDKKERYPVITLVLYFGYKKRWNKGKTLLESLKVSEELKPFVNDYKLNLFEIAFLEDDTLRKFKSDFRIIADYCVQMRKRGEFIPTRKSIKHPRELLEAMSAFTNDKRYNEGWELFSESETVEGINMCEFLDKLEARGRAEGISEGRKEADKAYTKLISKLVKAKRFDDLERAAEDDSFRKELFKELEIAY